MSAASEREQVADATDEEIDAVVAEFGGDVRQAIRALLHDLTQIALDSEAAVSRGYVRGNLLPFTLRKYTDSEKTREQAHQPLRCFGQPSRAARRSRNVPERRHSSRRRDFG